MKITQHSLPIRTQDQPYSQNTAACIRKIEIQNLRNAIAEFKGDQKAIVNPIVNCHNANLEDSRITRLYLKTIHVEQKMRDLFFASLSFLGDLGKTMYRHTEALDNKNLRYYDKNPL